MYRYLAVVACLAISGAPVAVSNGSPHCLSGARAETFLHGVRRLLTSTDSATNEWRAVYGFRRRERTDVRLVTNEVLCERAAQEYDKHAGPAGEHRLPYTVAVVQAPDLYFVELGVTAGIDADYWEVVVFSRQWKRLASYGGGS